MAVGGESLVKRMVRALVPQPLLRNRGIILRLGPDAGRIYARLRLLDTLGVRTENKKMAPPSAGCSAPVAATYLLGEKLVAVSASKTDTRCGSESS